MFVGTHGVINLGVDTKMKSIFNGCSVLTIERFTWLCMAAILDFGSSEKCYGSETMLGAFLRVENIGLDTKMKYIGGLLLKIFPF